MDDSSRKRWSWGSRNLIDSLGRDITDKISENDVATIITNYIRENPSNMAKKRRNTKTVACDERLRLLFERREINLVKLPDLVAKLYVDCNCLYSSKEEQWRLSSSDEMAAIDDFSKEECDELHQRIKSGFAKRFTVVDMEEKVRRLYEDSRLLHEVPEVVAEELEPECVNGDGKLENDFIKPNSEASFEAHQSDKEQQPSYSPVSSIQEDGVIHPTLSASTGDITHNKDSISEEEVEMIVVDNSPQAQPNPIEIIHLTDDDDDANEEKNNNRDEQHCDPTKVLWFYELPKGQTQGPFSITDLKKWNDHGYFAEIPDFKVWMRGESAESAVSLTKLLSYYISKNLTESKLQKSS